MKTIKIYITALLMMLCYPLQAVEEHLEAHVHGVVEMSLVAEADVVEIHIQSPLMNLVGFEHQAHTEAEHTAIEAMLAQFKAAENWLRFDPDNCQLTHQSVKSGEEENDHGHKHHHHDHGHDHDESPSEDRHADLEASYQFSCHAKELKAIDVLLADVFPGIEVINVNWIIDERAGIAQLHHGEQRVDFTP